MDKQKTVKENTLIQVKVETALELKSLKQYERESYNDTIKKLLSERKNKGRK